MTTAYDPATLRADLIRDESLRLKPYRCPAGKLTIGIGRNLDDVGISREEAETLLDHDIA
ncbi:glycoside hydrolase family protein, partial [Phaeospirillum tilakii]